MSLSLRLILFVASVLTAFLVLKKIKKSQFIIGDTLYWIVFCVLLFVMGVFPQIPVKLSEFLGFYSPANFVFLVCIFLLIIRVFQFSLKISKLEAKLTDLAQKYALDHKEEKP